MITDLLLTAVQIDHTDYVVVSTPFGKAPIHYLETSLEYVYDLVGEGFNFCDYYDRAYSYKVLIPNLEDPLHLDNGQTICTDNGFAWQVQGEGKDWKILKSVDIDSPQGIAFLRDLASELDLAAVVLPRDIFPSFYEEEGAGYNEDLDLEFDCCMSTKSGEIFPYLGFIFVNEHQTIVEVH